MSTSFESLIVRDIAANRPEAGVPGRLFFDTINSKWQRDSGMAWEDCVPETAAASGFYGTQLLRTVVGAGGAASLGVSDIAAGFDVIKIFVQGKTEKADFGTDDILIAFNGDTTATNYYFENLSATDTTDTVTEGDNRYIGGLGTVQDTAFVGQMEITIIYPESPFHKTAVGHSGVRRGAAQQMVINRSVVWENTAAITQITLTAGSGSDFAEGTLCVIVGYKNH